MSEIDLSVGYTQEALRAFGDDPARLQARMLRYRDRTNAILEASGAPVRLNILAVEAVSGFRQSTFAADRKRFIRGKRGGEVLERMRDRTGADVRLLLVNYRQRGSNVHYGGIFDTGRSRAGALKNAYVMIGTNADDVTFAHEIGHVLGCRHARRRPCLGGAGPGLPFGYGFRSREGIGTIMARSCATTRFVPLFSSPALSYNYKPVGAKAETTIALGSETADCVRAMVNNAPYLAGLNKRKAAPLKDDADGDLDPAPVIADLNREPDPTGISARR